MRRSSAATPPRASTTDVDVDGDAVDIASLPGRWARIDPSGEALVDRRTRLTFADVDEQATRAAGALAALGVGAGDRVAASLPNGVAIVVAFLGAMRLGAVWVGLGRALAPPERHHLLDDAGASVLLTTSALASQVAGWRGRVVEVGPDREWERLMGGDWSRPRVVEVDPLAPAAIAYTSGTTGRPKGAVHSQHNLLLPGAVVTAGLRRRRDRQGVCLPLTVLNLMVMGPLQTLQAGGCCVCIDGLDAVGVAERVRSERIVRMSGSPVLVHDLVTSDVVRPDYLRTLTNLGVGGATCPEELRRRYEERFSGRITSGYGLTEAPATVAREEPDRPHVVGSTGPAMAHVQLRIVGEDGAVLAPGEVGEVCVGPALTGPWAGRYRPMLGYWKQPEATTSVLRDGWLRTGDVGRLDVDGNLHVVGRRGDVVNRGGAKVYPAEVERVVESDDRVVACAIVGRPHERLGEEVVAFVEVAPGARLTAEEVQDRCRQQLARYKVPVDVVLVDELPRNRAGKVLRTELRDRLLSD